MLPQTATWVDEETITPRFIGAPEEIRTPDPQIRSLVLTFVSATYMLPVDRAPAGDTYKILYCLIYLLLWDRLPISLDNRRCYADHDFGCILVSLS